MKPGTSHCTRNSCVEFHVQPTLSSLMSLRPVQQRGTSMEDSQEFFWGCELSKENPTLTWSAKEGEEEGDEDYLIHTLFLKHAVLGTSAVKTERNVVQVETKNFEKNTIKIPMLSLTLGQADMCSLDVSFGSESPVTFTLVEGNGPVCITGQHLAEFPHDEMSQDESMLETDEEVGEEEEEEESVAESKKRKATTKATSKSKKGKMDESVSSEEDDEDDDEDFDEEDEEEDMEEEESSPEKVSKKKGAKKGKEAEKKTKGAKAKESPAAKKVKKVPKKAGKK